MTGLGAIIDRLLDDQLAAPSALGAVPLRRQQSTTTLYRHLETDHDTDDSQWLDMFTEHFILRPDPRQDDLLFFVRDQLNEAPLSTVKTHRTVNGPNSLANQAERKSMTSLKGPSLATDKKEDAVFVRRKQYKPSPSMPSVDVDAILWKETFYLNLIIQLPYKLTVAVCKRNAPPSALGMEPGNRSSMTCTRKYVSRKVYALPRKTRVDMKESAWECSWPLIYYVIEDFEDAFEQLTVKEGEYLCVELSAQPYDKHVHTAHGSTNSASSLEPDINVHSKSKIILFQGAASFTALLDIYQQKTSSKLNRRFRIGTMQSSTPPTEYIMMRGPGGKGHAQVAITAFNTGERPKTAAVSRRATGTVKISSTSTAAPSQAGLGGFGFFQQIRRSLFGYREPTDDASSDVSGTSEQSIQSLQNLRELSSQETLKCCMTFVNVPWTSIIGDLLNHAKKRRDT